MCSIIGSFSRSRLEELIEANKERGQHSCSFSVFEKTGELLSCQRYLQPIDASLIPDFIEGKQYVLAHAQAPTTSAKDLAAVHPAEASGLKLWHNGIISPKQLRAWSAHVPEHPWDTKMLADHVRATNFDLDMVDGSFACVAAFQKKLMVFRNDRCPLYIDNDLTLSSVPFISKFKQLPDPLDPLNTRGNLARYVPYCVLFELDLQAGELRAVKEFSLYRALFYFGDTDETQSSGDQ